MKVQEKPLFRTVQLPALIEAAEETVLTFQVPGLVNRMELQEGEKVKKGQILAQLDQRDFRNALASSGVHVKISQLLSVATSRAKP